ncbi:MAG: HAD family hydrolase [Thermoplasmata archaeon]|nr:HAD family hydrolase [Thermoplasmata archaeon]
MPTDDLPSLDPAPGGHRAVFVDRDGTLNPDVRYMSDPEQLEVFGGVATGLRWLRAHGYLIVCVTNQSGVDRGLYSDFDVQRIHARLNERLAREGTGVDAFYYCPHAPDRHCVCRKPGTALFERARDIWGIDFAASAIVGDRPLDVQAGDRLGLLTAVVLTPGREAEIETELRDRGVVPDVRAHSFAGAAARLLSRG